MARETWEAIEPPYVRRLLLLELINSGRGYVSAWPQLAASVTHSSSSMLGTDPATGPMDNKVSAHSPGVGELAPALEQALARICEAEGIAPAQVRSIQVDDGEISVRIERPGGTSRVVIYPVAIFAPKSTVR